MYGNCIILLLESFTLQLLPKLFGIIAGCHLGKIHYIVLQIKLSTFFAALTVCPITDLGIWPASFVSKFRWNCYVWSECEKHDMHETHKMHHKLVIYKSVCKNEMKFTQNNASRLLHAAECRKCQRFIVCQPFPVVCNMNSGHVGHCLRKKKTKKQNWHYNIVQHSAFGVFAVVTF